MDEAHTGLPKSRPFMGENFQIKDRPKPEQKHALQISSVESSITFRDVGGSGSMNNAVTLPEQGNGVTVREKGSGQHDDCVSAGR